MWRNYHVYSNTYLILPVDVGEDPLFVRDAHPQVLRLQVEEVPAHRAVLQVLGRVVECIQITEVSWNMGKIGRLEKL